MFETAITRLKQLFGTPDEPEPTSLVTAIVKQNQKLAAQRAAMEALASEQKRQAD